MMASEELRGVDMECKEKYVLQASFWHPSRGAPRFFPTPVVFAEPSDHRLLSRTPPGCFEQTGNWTLRKGLQRSTYRI